MKDRYVPLIFILRGKKMNKFGKLNAFSFLIFISASVPALAGPSFSVYDEGFGARWESQLWGATVTEITPTNSFKGTTVAKVEFSNSMGVFKSVAKGGFSTKGYKDITFAVFNLKNANDLWFVSQRTDGTLGTYLKVTDYADKWDLPQGKWSWVRIPISHLGLGVDPALSFFSVASGKAGSIAYFDDVGFAASSVLYEGARDFSYAPGMQLWHWNGTLTKSIRTYGNNYSIRMKTSSPWGGVQFQHRIANLKTSDYGAVSVRIKTADLSKANQFKINLTDNKGKVIGLGVPLNKTKLPTMIDDTQNDYYHFTIDMADFGISSASIGGLIVWAAEPSTFQIDDIRLIPKLKWVMKRAKQMGTNHDGRYYGDHWQNEYCDTAPYPKLHNGNDYVATAGDEVLSAARGVVVQKRELSGGWGYVVVIQHESSLTTSYLHLESPYVNVNDEVQQGTPIGKIAPIKGAHLHFGVRSTNFDEIFSQAGMMPEKECKIKGITYPTFPGHFLDSEKIFD